MNNNMIISQVGREPVTGTLNATQKITCIKLSVDVHAAKYKVVRQLGDLPFQPVQTFQPAEFLKFAEKQLGLAAQVYCCYEAGPTGFWLHRELNRLGVKNIVVVPELLDTYGRKVNNDHNDARQLARKHSRYLAGETDALATVLVPSLAAEQRRATQRQRGQFGKTVRSLASMGRSLCLLHGYRLAGSWWRGRGWEKARRTLPAWLCEHLERFRPTIAEAEKQIVELTKQLRARQAKRPLPVGLGPLRFEQIDSEVLDWNRFSNRKAPGSFVGLTGGVSSSGEQHADLPITKHGHRRLRALLIELAWRMVMYQPQCRAVQRWKHVLLTPHAHARRRKQAIVALARQLMIDLWRWRTGRVTPEKLGWIMNNQPS